jgi:cell wall-associated NlpC family hydrolase
MTAGVDRVLVGAPVAPLHAEARVSSSQTSQRLRGAPLVVLERQGEGGDWLRVRGDDGYEGWMHRGYLAPEPGAPTAARLRRTSLGCTVRTADGRRLVLPLGAGVRDDDEILEGDAADADALRRDFPADPRAIAHTAVERFEGTPYQWGGVTPWGADCSGLVQSCFVLHGVAMPRDAWQQGEAAFAEGARTLERLDELHAGDLLFFSDRPDRRITHVGISLGERRMVHLALGRGGYSVERLDETSDPYVARLVERFLFARRPLG